MKQKRKIKIKLIIFGIVIMLFGCSEDLYEKENSFNTQGIKVSKVSLKEPRLQNKTKLIKQVNKVKNKQEVTSNTNRIVYDSINNFYFDDENGMLIETTNGYESYTFKVFREVPNNYELENIVFSKIGTEYDVTLIKYELTPTEIEKLENNILFEPTVEPNIEVLSRLMACNTRINYCRAVYDPESGQVIGMLVTYLNPCEGSGAGVFVPAGGNGTGTGSGSGTGDSGSESGGGSGTGDSGSGSNGDTSSGTGTSWEGGGSGNTYSGGGSSGSEEEGLLTVPTNGGSTTPILPPDPCITLKEAKNNTNVQTAIDFLKTKTTGKQEFAYEIERRRAGSTYSTILHTGGNFGLSVPYGIPVQGQAHNHPINGVAIPSWDDIYWTQLCEGDNGEYNNETAFNIVVSPNPTIIGGTILYAVTIDNIITLEQATNAVFNLPEIVAETDEKIKREKIMKMFGDKFADMQTNTITQEKTFLQTFATYGITLSKFNDATGKWEKLKIDPTNPNNVIKEPCI